MFNVSVFDPEKIAEWLSSSGLRILLIVLLSLASARFITLLGRYLTRRFQSMDDFEGSERDRQAETVYRLVNTTGLAIITGTALLMILQELSINIGPLLASVGVLSLALGLGAQTLVKDVIGGLFIFIEGQYQVGDNVELNGVVGTVEQMTLRATQVRDYEGYLHIVPNGEIRMVTNRMRGWTRAVVDVGITYDEDVEKAERTLLDIGRRAATDAKIGPMLLEAPTVTGIEGLDDWQVRLRMIVRTVPNQQFEVQRYLRHQIQQAFTKEEISLASPRQEIVLLKREGA